MKGLLIIALSCCLTVSLPAEPQERFIESRLKHYTYRVISKLPFDPRNFTQGLEIHDQRLYVSSGLYGRSAIRVYSFPKMELLKERLIQDEIFAEGLTIIGDRLFLLSWRARKILVFSVPNLNLMEKLELPTEQGWGASHRGSTLWFSDGSSRLYSTDFEKGQAVRSIKVTLRGKHIRNLNELEWVNDEIWANLWQTDDIARIDPTSGTVLGIIHLNGILPKVDKLQNTDVLNGIARDPITGAIWITGKRWPWLYQIELENKF